MWWLFDYGSFSTSNSHSAFGVTEVDLGAAMSRAIDWGHVVFNPYLRDPSGSPTYALTDLGRSILGAIDMRVNDRARGRT